MVALLAFLALHAPVRASTASAFEIGAATAIPLGDYVNPGLQYEPFAASPYVAVQGELSGRADHVGVVGSIETMPTLAYLVSENGCCTVLAATTGGVWLGDERFEVGPYVTGGWIVYGAGLRLALQPWARKNGRPRGLELRVGGLPWESLELVVAYRRVHPKGA